MAELILSAFVSLMFAILMFSLGEAFNGWAKALYNAVGFLNLFVFIIFLNKIAFMLMK